MLRRNGITMLIIALLLLTAYGSFVPAEASPTTGVVGRMDLIGVHITHVV